MIMMKNIQSASVGMIKIIIGIIKAEKIYFFLDLLELR